MSTSSNPLARTAEVLLVEDNPGDARLLQEALREAKLRLNLHVVMDGEEAIAFLRRQGQHASAPRPDLVLLDLNLPRKDGRETLAEIKGDPDLRRIPVAVLTVSAAEEDILKSYNLNANCYIRKPAEFADFVRVVHAIEEFWFNIVTLPPDGERG